MWVVPYQEEPLQFFKADQTLDTRDSRWDTDGGMKEWNVKNVYEVLYQWLPHEYYEEFTKEYFWIMLKSRMKRLLHVNRFFRDQKIRVEYLREIYRCAQPFPRISVSNRGGNIIYENKTKIEDNHYRKW